MSKIEADVYLGLVHNPIYNKLDEVITTTVTNYDLHDISRAAKTYDIKKYYIINNLKSQQELVERVKDYWTGGRGAGRSAIAPRWRARRGRGSDRPHLAPPCGWIDGIGCWRAAAIPAARLCCVGHQPAHPHRGP